MHFKIGEIQVGDYLEYKPISGRSAKIEKEKTGYSQTQLYEVDEATTWRILGLDKTGTQLLIVSGSPIKKVGDDPYLYLSGVEGYTYAVENLNKISNIYYNEKYATQARSITMEDITHVLGITIDKQNNRAYKTEDSTKAVPYVGYFDQSYTYKSGDYAPENYMGTGSKKVGDNVEGTAYMLPITNESVVEQNGKLYEVLFKGTEDSSKSYWLASPGIFIDNQDAHPYASFSAGFVRQGAAAAGGYYMFYTHGNYIESCLAVRPIITLRSDITIEDVKITTGEEEEWKTNVKMSEGKIVSKGQVLNADS